MPRYTFSITYHRGSKGNVGAYIESTVEEDELDMADDYIMTDFTGNGYLKFWKRCKQEEIKFNKVHPDVSSYGCCIDDTYFGVSKEW